MYMLARLKYSRCPLSLVLGVAYFPVVGSVVHVYSVHDRMDATTHSKLQNC